MKYFNKELLLLKGTSMSLIGEAVSRIIEMLTPEQKQTSILIGEPVAGGSISQRKV